MKVAVGSRSDVGRVRDGNQDSYFAERPLFVVADGMGGHLGGDVASATAIETISSGLSDSGGHPDPDVLAELVKSANKRIWDRSQGDPSLRGMGTTCTLMFLEEDEGLVVHVGDSRLYLFREGGLNQLSEDHTLVGQMVREGRLSEEEARHHPQRSIITRALGVDADVRVDVFQIELRNDDALLICSDGLTSMVDDEDIKKVLEEGTDAQTAADRLVELANHAGGEDNITVVVLDTRAEAVAAADTAPPPPDSTGAPVRDKDTGELGEPAEVEDEGRRSAGAQDEEDESGYEPGRSSWIRRLVWALALLIVVAAGAYFGLRYWLNNSYYVAATGSGVVGVYQGVDGRFAGFDLSHVEVSTALKVSDLPQNLRDNVNNGLGADSLGDAKSKVSSLQDAATRYQQQLKKQRQSRHKKRSGSGGGT